MIDDRPLAIALLGCTYKLDEYIIKYYKINTSADVLML